MGNLKLLILPIQAGLFGLSLTNQLSDSKIIEMIYKLMANHSMAFTLSALSHLWYNILLDIFDLIVYMYSIHRILSISIINQIY